MRLRMRSGKEAMKESKGERKGNKKMIDLRKLTKRMREWVKMKS